MENLLDVVAERDRAVNLLETGRSGEPEPYEDKNILGIPEMRTPTEHFVPKHLHPFVIHKKNMSGRWQEKWLVKLAEKKLKHERWQKRHAEKEKKKLKEIFPDAEID